MTTPDNAMVTIQHSNSQFPNSSHKDARLDKPTLPAKANNLQSLLLNTTKFPQFPVAKESAQEAVTFSAGIVNLLTPKVDNQESATAILALLEFSCERCCPQLTMAKFAHIKHQKTQWISPKMELLCCWTRQSSTAD